MTIGALHRRSLSAAVILSVLGVASGSLLLGVGALATALVVLGTGGALLATERSRARLLLVHGGTVLVLAFALAVFREARIDSVLLITMLGIANRFALRAGSRDDLIVLGAACVLMVAATTVTPGVAFLGLVVGFLPCALWALLASTLLGLGERGPSDPRALSARLARIAGRPMPPIGMKIALGAWGLMLGGFLAVSLLPRYSFGGIFSPGYLVALPGASSTMELSSDGVSGVGAGGGTVRVEPLRPELRASVEGLYARLYALDRFDGRRWSSGKSGGRFMLHPSSERYRGGEGGWAPSDGPEVVRVSMDRLVARNEPHPAVTVGRARPSAIRLAHLEQDASGTWFFRPRTSSVRPGYMVDLSRAPVVADLPPVAREAEASLLEVPAGTDARIIELGQQLSAGKESTAEKLTSVLAFLSRGFRYSVEPLPGASPDPLARFLFEAKQGHCELYAGALALLLRIGGVRARVVTGYYGGWWNGRGGYLQLEDQDAHAWVEVLDDDGGISWADATPEGQRTRRTDSVLAWVRDLYDALEALWYDRVVEFDDVKRRRMLAGLLASLGELGDRIEGPQLTASQGGALRPGRRAGLALGGLAGAVALGLVVVARRRRSPERLGRRLRAALGADDRENVTLGTILARAPRAWSAEARAAVECYEALRFGPAETAPSPSEVEARIAAVRARRRKARG